MDQIERIKKFEDILDRLNVTSAELAQALERAEVLSDEFVEFCDYYGSEVWFADYDDDSVGKLPADLKRGVLSEDGIFDLLEENRALQVKLAETLAKVIRKGSF